MNEDIPKQTKEKVLLFLDEEAKTLTKLTQQ